MMNGIFKELYRGHGIYWFGRQGYGDETNPMARTIGEVRARIDAKIAADDAARPAHLLYWDTLPHEERNKWRRACQTTELSASELAYTNRKGS
jgi:hypothetical protein